VDSREIRTMRGMAWERAKGELRSMLQTYYDSDTGEGMDRTLAFEAMIDDFVAKVEDEGLQE